VSSVSFLFKVSGCLVLNFATHTYRIYVQYKFVHACVWCKRNNDRPLELI